MNKPNIILIGAGGHAKSCIDVINSESKYNIFGLIGLSSQVGSKVCGYPIIGTDDQLNEIVNDVSQAVIAIGDQKKRSILYKYLINNGFKLPNIIAKGAYISRYSSMGQGNIFMHDVIINADVQIGNNCIFNTRALIEHDSTIDDNCHISTGAILNGNVKVEKDTFIGSGAKIMNGIKIGKNSIIGMGLSVRHDQKDNSKFIG